MSSAAGAGCRSLPPYRALPDSPVYRYRACARTRAGARAHARDSVNTPKPGNPPVRGKSGNAPPAPELHVTILKHCRCMDCRKFRTRAGEYFCRDHIGGTIVVWATGERICDPTPSAWHYCAGYDGPQISKDVWVWPRAQKKGPAPGGGGPSSGPAMAEPIGGDRPSRVHCSAPAVEMHQVAPQAAQVGAGSNIPALPAGPTTSAEGRDVREPGASGSFLNVSRCARGGNSRASVVCLSKART